MKVSHVINSKSDAVFFAQIKISARKSSGWAERFNWVEKEMVKENNWLC